MGNEGGVGEGQDDGGRSLSNCEVDGLRLVEVGKLAICPAMVEVVWVVSKREVPSVFRVRACLIYTPYFRVGFNREVFFSYHRPFVVDCYELPNSRVCFPNSRKTFRSYSEDISHSKIEGGPICGYRVDPRGLAFFRLG